MTNTFIFHSVSRLINKSTVSFGKLIRANSPLLPEPAEAEPLLFLSFLSSLGYSCYYNWQMWNGKGSKNLTLNFDKQMYFLEWNMTLIQPGKVESLRGRNFYSMFLPRKHHHTSCCDNYFIFYIYYQMTDLHNSGKEQWKTIRKTVE